MIRWLMRWFFERLYTTWAWGYDLVAWVVSLGRWWTWARLATAPLPPVGRLLEIGCGTGHLLSEIAGARQVIGIDRSRQMARLAQRRVRRRGSKALVVLGDARALPFADRSFDGAYASFPAEQVFQVAAFRSIQRVLKPGCDYILVVLALLKPSTLLHRGLRWLFAATGQDGPLEPSYWNERVPAPGFAVEVEVLEMESADVVRVRASVPRPPNG